MPVRKLQVDLSQGFERHWFRDAQGRPDAFRSAYYNALSMSFPAGEQFFIDSVKRMQPRLNDSAEHAAMKLVIRDFCAQEATHRHVHAQYNAQLEKQGFKNHLEPRIWARFKRHEHVHPMHHLAVTVAYEHYTAVLSDSLLRTDAMTAGMSPEMRQAWRWHALEETEHKAVAFDVYQALGGNHIWRVRWFIYVSIIFTIDTFRQTVNNLWHDGSLFKPRTWLSAAQFFFGSPKRGGGWVWLTAHPLWDYFRKDFHPNQHDNRELASDYAQTHQADWRLVR
jgi:uncharacterized protein